MKRKGGEGVWISSEKEGEFNICTIATVIKKNSKKSDTAVVYEENWRTNTCTNIRYNYLMLVLGLIDFGQY